ncbi:MAG: M48 family metallopeptidase [Candidatus Dormibacteraeota bacterium]|nr:M48 family metallopeptidase [Candidatus Dormibacteraeota bacterium]
MITKQLDIEVINQKVDVVFKDIKNLHLAVYPPNGRVRVAAPLRLDVEAIRLAVISRLGWIRRQQARFQVQERQSEREFVTGEAHYFQGRRYRMRVIESDDQLIRRSGNTTLELRVRKGSSRQRRESIVSDWYRRELRLLLAPLVEKWREVIGVEPSTVAIRRMKTMWGTCNPESGRISLNLELIKKSPASLEYVLVHELCHLHEGHHTVRFRQLMDRFMPNWRTRRDELNAAPLAHEDWNY